jgi:hypothetical protein
LLAFARIDVTCQLRAGDFAQKKGPDLALPVERRELAAGGLQSLFDGEVRSDRAIKAFYAPDEIAAEQGTRISRFP